MRHGCNHQAALSSERHQRLRTASKGSTGVGRGAACAVWVRSHKRWVVLSVGDRRGGSSLTPPSAPDQYCSRLLVQAAGVAAKRVTLGAGARRAHAPADHGLDPVITAASGATAGSPGHETGSLCSGSRCCELENAYVHLFAVVFTGDALLPCADPARYQEVPGRSGVPERRWFPQNSVKHSWDAVVQNLFDLTVLQVCQHRNPANQVLVLVNTHCAHAHDVFVQVGQAGGERARGISLRQPSSSGHARA